MAPPIVEQLFQPVPARLNQPARLACKQCSNTYAWKPGDGTGSLSGHYQRRHAGLWLDFQQQLRTSQHSHAAAIADDLQSVASSAATPSKRSAESSSSSDSISCIRSKKQKSTSLGGVQTTLQHTFAVSSNAQVLKQMALFFADNHIAHNVASSPSFRAFVDAVRVSTCDLPHRNGVKSAISSLADEMREKLWVRLRSAAAPVAIAVDGWTNVQHVKVTNILLISGGVAFYWCSIANALEKNTAAWLHAAIQSKLQELHAGGVRFSAFIADNEAVNNALFDLLLQSFPFLVRVPCAAHTIQLVAKRAMKCTRWAAVREKIDDILRGFATSKDARLKLRNLQAGEAHTYCLVKPNDTRWNSHLHAAERLLRLSSFVDICFKQPHAFWSEVAAYISFLKPFEVATDVVQRDSATLYDVFTQWSALYKHAADQEDAAMKKEVQRALKNRWESQVNTAAAIAAALLSLEVDLEKAKVPDEAIEKARRFIVSFGTHYLLFFKLSSLSADELKGTLLNQLGQFTAKHERFQPLDEDVRLTKKSAGEKWSALNVWALYNVELSVVARALLTMPASEAAVERSFSTQGAVHSKLRNRLHGHAVEQEMFVSFNSAALRCQQRATYAAA
jgi:hypothetical protein